MSFYVVLGPARDLLMPYAGSAWPVTVRPCRISLGQAILARSGISVASLSDSAAGPIRRGTLQPLGTVLTQH